MTPSIKRKIRALRPIFVALWSVLYAVPTFAVQIAPPGGNRIKDLHVERREERARIAFLMDHLPSMQVSDVVQPGQASIRLPDVSMAAPGQSRMSAEKGGVSLVGADGAPGLEVLIPDKKGFREVSARWLGQESIMVVDLFPPGGEIFNPSTDAAIEMKQLKGVRFGPGKDFTRVVLDLDKRPAFQVIWADPKAVVLNLNRTKTASKLKPAGTVKRLKGISLAQEKDDLRLRLLCESIPVAWRVFWLDEGNRLVVDLFDSTRGTWLEAVKLPRDFGRHLKSAADPPEPAIRTKAPSSEESPGLLSQPPSHASSMPFDVPDEKALPPPAHPPMPTSSGVHYVRLPIVKGEKPAAGPTAAGGPSPEDHVRPSQERHEAAHDPSRAGLEAKPLPLNEAFMGELEPEEALLYGRVLEAMNFRDYERGVELVTEFLDKFPDSKLMERMIFVRAEFLYHLVESGRTDMLQEMEEFYGAAIRQFAGSPQVPQAYLRMAKGSALAGQDFPALGYLNTLLAKFPGHPLRSEALLERGKAYLRGGSPEKGLRDFKMILKDFPQSHHCEAARYGIATYFYRRGMYGETLTWLTEIERLHPTFEDGHPEYLSMRGQTHLYLGQYPEAREWYYKALNLGTQPETPDLILAHIGDAYLQDGRKKEAEALYKLVVDTFKGTEGAVIAQLRLGDFPESDGSLKEVAEENQATPVGELAVLKMAEVYYRRGEYPETMDALKDLVRVTPENQVQGAGLDLFLDSAEKQMSKLYNKDQWESLIELFRTHEKILYGKIRPESQFLLSQALQKLKHYDAAISSFIQISPEDLGTDLRWRYFLELADAYRMSSDLDKAKEVLEAGLNGQLTREGRQHLEKRLADVFRQKENDKGAYALYERLIRAESPLPQRQTAEVLLSLGEILNGEGKYAKGREWLEKAVDLTEAYPAYGDLHAGALAALGDGYSREQRPKEALRCYDKALKAGYGSDRAGYWGIKFRMAEAHLALGERTQAKQIFREIQEEGDANLQARVQLRLGSMDLEDQLMRLSAWAKPSGAGNGKP